MRSGYKPTIFKHAKKLARFLDMMYKPAEIADELGVTRDTVVRSYIPAGCPHVKDATGHTWINGKEFAKWASEITQARLESYDNESNREKLKENQAYCMHCRQRVEFTATSQKDVKRWTVMVLGTCNICGGKVNKLKKKVRQ